MTIGIILTIIALICCIIAFIISVINSDIIDGIIMLLLACFNVFMLKCYLDINNEPQDISFFGGEPLLHFNDII